MKIDRDELAALSFRRELCKFCIKTIDEMKNGTPGKEEAMKEYKRQLASIDGKITEITGTPPPIVVGLKTASLIGRAGLE